MLLVNVVGAFEAAAIADTVCLVLGCLVKAPWHVRRQVKLADSSVQSYGGLTTCTDYHLIRKDESVVDSVFMHDKYASPGTAGDESAMVVFTGAFRLCKQPCVD